MIERQHIGEFELVRMPDDAQADMIRRKIEFQRRLGAYDERLSPLHPRHGSFADAKRAIHHLDMALHEAHEAWDELEGGWKHHKRNPRPPDWGEVLMELVDVANFAFNAYAFMGGQPDGDAVAAAVNESLDGKSYVRIEWRQAWAIGTGAWTRGVDMLESMYGHGRGAHGDADTKACATRVNRLIHAIAETAGTLRHYARANGYDAVPAAPGFVYESIVPWICAAADAVPGVGPAEFYSAFLHKERINHRRQDDGY